MMANETINHSKTDIQFVSDSQFYLPRGIIDKNEKNCMDLCDIDTGLKNMRFSKIQKTVGNKSVIRKSIQSEEGDSKSQNSEYHMKNLVKKKSEENFSIRANCYNTDEKKNDTFTGYMMEKNASCNLYLRAALGGKCDK